MSSKKMTEILWTTRTRISINMRGGGCLLSIELDVTIRQEINLPECAPGRETGLTSLFFRGDELMITDPKARCTCCGLFELLP